MAKIEDAAEVTPSRPLPTLKKQNSSVTSDKSQRSILGFFSKAASNGTQPASGSGNKTNGLSAASNGNSKLPSTSKKATFTKSKVQNVTPLPSSDPADILSSQENVIDGPADEVDTSLPSPLTPAKSHVKQVVNGMHLSEFSSPSRRVSMHNTLI